MVERLVGIEEARGSLGRLVDEVTETSDPVVLARRGRAAAVLVSAEEYAALKQVMNERAREALTAKLDQVRRAVRKAGLDAGVVDEAIAAARRL